jgi:hypothetical protein
VRTPTRASDPVDAARVAYTALTDVLARAGVR